MLKPRPLMLNLVLLTLAVSACGKAPEAPSAPMKMPPPEVTYFTVQAADVPGSMDFVGQTGASSKV